MAGRTQSEVFLETVRLLRDLRVRLAAWDEQMTAGPVSANLLVFDVLPALAEARLTIIGARVIDEKVAGRFQARAREEYQRPDLDVLAVLRSVREGCEAGMAALQNAVPTSPDGWLLTQRVEAGPDGVPTGAVETRPFTPGQTAALRAALAAIAIPDFA
jgi:hypothetical protein